MTRVQFYVEGPSDRKFLQDIIQYWYSIILPTNAINILDGKDNLKSRFEDELIKNRANFITDQISEIRSVVILDADNDPVHRKLTVSKLANIHKFDFLWPNNSLPGDLESILETVYNPDQQLFFDCWRAYEQCLGDSRTYYLPNRKGKIYAYLQSMLGHSESQQDFIGKLDKRNFLNESHWNLNPTHPPLQPLKKFLDPFFSIP